MSAYVKNIIEHDDLCVAVFTKSRTLPYMLFIHGGPGFNSGVLDYLIEHEGIFNLLEANIILYDQQGCGRSKSVNKEISHADNLHDLNELYKLLTESMNFNVAAMAGHSYGAKLLFDYLQVFNKKIPSIFIATASSMLVPRINNLLLDLSYLKMTDKDEYERALEEFDGYNSVTLWKLTERLAKVFQENKTRPYFYWANLTWKDKVTAIQNSINLPINAEVFRSVRQNLYTNAENISVDIEVQVTSPYLWINGFHDLIMNGVSNVLKEDSSIRVFFKSAHYPHIEEYARFCDEVNIFLENIIKKQL